MVVLHSNCWIDGNAYLITYQVGPLRAQTHTCFINPAVDGSTGGKLPKFGKYGDWVMKEFFFFPRWRIAALQATCGSVSYSDAETAVPAICRVASSLCKTPMQKWPVTVSPGGTNPWYTKPCMSKNSENLVTAPRTIALEKSPYLDCLPWSEGQIPPCGAQ
jgi:hypothetical protein